MNKRKTGPKQKRLARAKRTRCKLRELGMPRLCVYRSGRHIYSQIINADGNRVLASASSLEKDIRGKTSCNVAGAKVIGELIAKRASSQKIKKVGFDRSGYKYHGCIKALAEAARAQGLEL